MGFKQYHCSVCNRSFSIILPFSDHTFEDDAETETIPINEEAHNFSDWYYVELRDCQTMIMESRTCSYCGKVETRSTKYYGDHDYIETLYIPATCIKEDILTIECTICGDKIEEVQQINEDNHKGSYKLVIDEAATTEIEGIGHYEWSYCGLADYHNPVTIPQLTEDNSKDLLKEIVGITSQYRI